MLYDVQPSLALSAAIAACIAGALWWLLSRAQRHAHDEPPLLKPQIPLIGHALGMLREGTDYYARLCRENAHLPAFTLDLLAAKVYIINSPSLVAAVQRNHRTLLFEPILLGAASRMAGIRDRGLELLRREQDGKSLSDRVLGATHAGLSGLALKRLNENMAGTVKEAVDKLVSCREPLDLHEWCRHVLTVASTDAVYGPLNPYKSQEIVDGFWDYENNLNLLLLNLFPRFSAAKAFTGREKVVRAFLAYYGAGGQRTASELALGRWREQNDAGASVEDIARLETAAGTGILSNTVPTAFWLLFDIFSRPALLADIRAELIAHAVRVEVDYTAGDGKEGELRTLDLAAVRQSCKLLTSTLQETLRTHSRGAPIRAVMDDVRLSFQAEDETVFQYRLAKSSLLQIPARALNHHTSMWGPTAAAFEPERFVQGDAKQKLRPTGFLAFGAAPNLCPGRHFAAAEVVALVALVLLRVDLGGVGGRKGEKMVVENEGETRWVAPRVNKAAVAASLGPPVEGACMVRVEAREEARDVQWKVDVGEGETRFGLVTG